VTVEIAATLPVIFNFAYAQYFCADFAMNEPYKLDYARPDIRSGHSPFGIASVCLAITLFLFVIGVLLLQNFRIDPFDSMGNEKQIRIGTVAAILGILLGVRALGDPIRKQILGIVGLCLNSAALLAVWVCLPCL
jgi:hypothetical protein